MRQRNDSLFWLAALQPSLDGVICLPSATRGGLRLAQCYPASGFLRQVNFPLAVG